MNLKRRFLLYVVLAGAFAATTVARAGVFENLETAEEAYLFAFPMIAAYKAMYQFNITTTFLTWLNLLISAMRSMGTTCRRIRYRMFSQL